MKLALLCTLLCLSAIVVHAEEECTCTITQTFDADTKCLPEDDNGSAKAICTTFGGTGATCTDSGKIVTSTCNLKVADETQKTASKTACENVKNLGLAGTAVGDWTCNAAGCFPASSRVLLMNGEERRMDELSVGDRVHVGSNRTSDVIIFSHQLREAKVAFVRLSTSKTAVTLTPGHYLYVNGKMAAARTARVGDMLTSADNVQVPVISVETVWEEGLYNPHTVDGDIVVDGILTSTYTMALEPRWAHALLWPIRALYNLGALMPTSLNAFADLGPKYLPEGLNRYE